MILTSSSLRGRWDNGKPVTNWAMVKDGVAPDVLRVLRAHELGCGLKVLTVVDGNGKPTTDIWPKEGLAGIIGSTIGPFKLTFLERTGLVQHLAGGPEPVRTHFAGDRFRGEVRFQSTTVYYVATPEVVTELQPEQPLTLSTLRVEVRTDDIDYGHGVNRTRSQLRFDLSLDSDRATYERIDTNHAPGEAKSVVLFDCNGVPSVQSGDPSILVSDLGLETGQRLDFLGTIQAMLATGVKSVLGDLTKIVQRAV